MTTETRTYVGQTGTQAFDGFMGLRIDTRYMGAVQKDGVVVGAGVAVSSKKWFRKYN
jgi:hypothetical protein